jgi:hypothetical protein
MREEDVANLRHSLKTYGFDMAFPIYLWEGMILDGRTRYMLCQELGIEPYCVQWVPSPGDTPECFVWRTAVARRHFSTSERACMIVDFADKYAKANEITVTQATSDMAQTAKVSKSTVETARRIKRDAPEVFDRVAAGEITVNEGKKIVEKQATTPPPAKVVRDGAGNTVPEREVKEALKSRDVFENLCGNLHAIKREIMDLAKKPEGRALRIDQIELDVKNAVEAVRFAMPFATCPYTTCKKSGCKACNGSRWVTRNVWENIPVEIREASR